MDLTNLPDELIIRLSNMVNQVDPKLDELIEEFEKQLIAKQYRRLDIDDVLVALEDGSNVIEPLTVLLNNLDRFTTIDQILDQIEVIIFGEPTDNSQNTE